MAIFTIRKRFWRLKSYCGMTLRILECPKEDKVTKKTSRYGYFYKIRIWRLKILLWDALKTSRNLKPPRKDKIPKINL